MLRVIECFAESLKVIPNYILECNNNNNNNNNKNTNANVYGAIITAEPLREFTQFIL